MINAPIPDNEQERLAAVHEHAILDTKPEERFDLLTKEAVEQFSVPISMISILDSNREWYKSCQGLDIREGDRKISFCGHALLASNVFIIEDTLQDKRFVDNPSVTGYPYIRFYAGVALHDEQTKLPIGVFCIKDTKPRKLSVSEVALLLNLASRAEEELNKK
jgi:GAF domain-containing protein